MQIINTQDINEARKQIQKLKKAETKEEIAILSQNDEFNRKALELKGIDVLIINEQYPWKDYMKQRASGLNEVLARICAEKGIKIGIQIEEIIKKSDIEKAKSLSRLSQNIMLCKKAGARLIFISDGLRDKRALHALLISLGASTKQAREAAKESF